MGTSAKEATDAISHDTKLVLGGLVLAFAYLAACPTPIAPVAWEAPSSRGLAVDDVPTLQQALR